MQGCGGPLLNTFRTMFFRYVIQDAIAVILILITLALVIWLGVKLWRKRHPKPVYNTRELREQEDDIESAVIPGTPFKSYISSSQKTYYAL